MLTDEAAERLGLQAGTIRRQIAKGKLRARKVGRDWQITPGEVERYRREHRGVATGGPKAGRRPAPFLAPAVAEAMPELRKAIVAFSPAPKPSQRKRRAKA